MLEAHWVTPLLGPHSPFYGKWRPSTFLRVRTLWMIRCDLVEGWVQIMGTWHIFVSCSTKQRFWRALTQYCSAVEWLWKKHKKSTREVANNAVQTWLIQGRWALDLFFPSNRRGQTRRVWFGPILCWCNVVLTVPLPYRTYGLESII